MLNLSIVGNKDLDFNIRMLNFNIRRDNMFVYFVSKMLDVNFKHCICI